MKPLAAIVLVLAFGVQARPAHSTAGHRTPVEIHLVSVGSGCGTADPDWAGDMDRPDYCWRSGRGSEQLALMPIVRLHTETEWIRKEAPQKRDKRNVLADTTLVFHWKPGVWFMLMRVDCDREAGMEAVITDPNGKVLCPLPIRPWAATVANKCDCLGFSFGHGFGHGGAHGPSFLSASAWHPRPGLYRIRVKGLAPCRIVVTGGAQFSRQPHWGAADAVSIGPGEERAWAARWKGVTAGDSSRVTLQRVGGPNP